jgi:hypothetical protein
VLLGQLRPHWPLEHTCPDEQAWPHAPQLLGSFISSTQAPAQRVAGPVHVGAHTPFAQCSPDGHAWPQWPQLRGSLVVCTHSLPQRIVPGRQPQ